MTSLQGGVRFKILADQSVFYRMSWIDQRSQSAWLVLDWNENGRIDDLSELFGNLTPQPGPFSQRNGFKALAIYDEPSQGGNHDGEISSSDLVFSKLRLWLDANHDGVSQPGELTTLQSHGIEALDLDFRESKKTDEFGNQFKYRARIRKSPGSQVNPWAWDVYLLIQRMEN